ncbi:SKP1-like protein 21 [Camellia lanceoleosa]|uniref:SKP1-like protein 21 n=1 Tax=Camellia lanceoleosa TaxID=1840588 RepID=A0ACC0H6C4_9ERIC|nr:SKP1-like protein 21 [Camellia lanceoleosa]
MIIETKNTHTPLLLRNPKQSTEHRAVFLTHFSSTISISLSFNYLRIDSGPHISESRNVPIWNAPVKRNSEENLHSLMSEGTMAIVKPEMKSYIWVQTADGSIQQVEEEVAMFCPMICREVLQTGMGSSKNYAISLPQRVNPAVLGLILDYCRFHQLPGRSNKERKTFDEKFVRLDTKKLCELTSAADSLQLRPLVDLTSRALARMIEGKTPEEIRETFNLPDDLTEEEKLEPLRNITDDPRIRLLNRLYARKRKELKERERLKNVEVEEECVDERSVDELLSFINGGNGGVWTIFERATKNKKKPEEKRSTKDSSSNNENGSHDKNDMVDIVATPNKTSILQDSTSVAFSPKLEFDDSVFEDELDPAMKEELDRRFCHWAKIEDLYQSLCNGNGSLKRYTGLDQRQ